MWVCVSVYIRINVSVAILHLQRRIYPQCFGLLDNQDKNKSNKIISICGFFYQTCTFLKKIFRMINLARKSKCNFKHDLIFSGLNQPFTSAIHIDFSSMIVMNFECNCLKGAKVKATGHFYQRSSSWNQYHTSVPSVSFGFTHVGLPMGM